ncbi:ISSfl2 ORF [Shigella sonnei]|nr:ISSfl2 ORF [Shigella sonnei]
MLYPVKSNSVFCTGVAEKYALIEQWRQQFPIEVFGNDSNLLIVFYVQIMPDDFVMQLHRF